MLIRASNSESPIVAPSLIVACGSLAPDIPVAYWPNCDVVDIEVGWSRVAEPAPYIAFCSSTLSSLGFSSSAAACSSSSASSLAFDIRRQVIIPIPAMIIISRTVTIIPIIIGLNPELSSDDERTDTKYVTWVEAPASFTIVQTIS